MKKIISTVFILLFVISCAQVSSSVYGVGQMKDENNDRIQTFFQAAFYGDVSELKKYIASGQDVNEKDQKGNSALYYAVVKNRLDAVNMLLDSGASGINDLYDFSLDHYFHLMSYAALAGYSELVESLLKHGADPNLLDGDGRSVLAMPIATGDVQILKMLLDTGIDPNSRWRNGFSAISLAALHGRVDILQMLVDYKANVDFRENHGLTPLMFAVQQGREGAVDFLIKQGAPVYPLNAWGKSALADVSEIKDPDVASRIRAMLVNAGAKNTTKPRDIDHEFLYAVYENNVAKVKELLAKGADLNARGVYDGHLFIRDAMSACVKSINMCRLLLDKGANPFVRDSAEFTALHAAADSGSPEVIEMLVSLGLDPDAESDSHFVPLFQTINGTVKIKNFEMLLKLGADPNAYTISRNVTILEYARGRKLNKVVDLLIAAGAKQ